MPCNSEYLNARPAEKESKKCAENIVFVMHSLLLKCPEWILYASNNYYGDENKLEDMVIILCDLCTKMTSEQKNIIIYDGKNKKSRQLADWWDDHKKADIERKEKENLGGSIS